MADRQLIIAVEGTASLGSSWRMIATDYIEKIIRSFFGNEVPEQSASSPNVELALVIFNAHGSYSGCIVQRTVWTNAVDTFLQWLYGIRFSGGGFNDYVAMTEGLSEALMMFSPLSPSAGQYQQNVDGKKHCILVAASDPFPLPTLVFRPQLQSRLSDAEAVAKLYARCSISLSVICPKQLPKLRAIYNAGKQNPHVADTPVDAVKSTRYLVLISDNFKEARAALSRSNHVKIWEGNLTTMFRGQLVFMTRLECYRHIHTPASEKLTEKWPSTLHIGLLMPHDQMNEKCKQYVEKPDYLVFGALDSHNLLGQMHEKKCCAVIQLVSQTLLLSAPDEPCRLLGMIFPFDMVASGPPQARDAHSTTSAIAANSSAAPATTTEAATCD